MTGGEPIPLAVVGAGRVASAVHLPLIRLMPGAFRLVAIVESDPDRAARLAREQPGVPVAARLDEAFRAGARAVLCSTPWPTHREVILEALAEGAAVLTEKPVSLSPDELAELRKAEASAAGGPVAVGYMKRHDPAAARFIEQVAARLDRLRHLAVDIVDPDAPSQVAHRLAAPLTPSPATRAAAVQHLDRLFGSTLTPGQRAVYGRSLGGSLIHQVNLVHAAFADSAYGLRGRLAYAVHWAEGAAVSCGWWPTEGFGVQMRHIRAPQAADYRETIEAVADDCRLTLQAPSPYLLDRTMELTEEHADGRVVVHRSPPTRNGFARQLAAWAAALRDPGAPALPGLGQAAADVDVVLEAAAASRGPAPEQGAEQAAEQAAEDPAEHAVERAAQRAAKGNGA